MLDRARLISPRFPESVFDQHKCLMFDFNHYGPNRVSLAILNGFREYLTNFLTGLPDTAPLEQRRRWHTYAVQLPLKSRMFMIEAVKESADDTQPQMCIDNIRLQQVRCRE